MSRPSRSNGSAGNEQRSRNGFSSYLRGLTLAWVKMEHPKVYDKLYQAARAEFGIQPRNYSKSVQRVKGALGRL